LESIKIPTSFRYYLPFDYNSMLHQLAKPNFFPQKNIFVFWHLMKRLLETIIHFADTINEAMGRLASWFTLALVLLVCFDVIRRGLIDDTEAWIMELEWHFFALIFLLGAGYALKHDRHVRVDLFYANFSERNKAWVNLIGTLVFLLPWCLIIGVMSFQYAAGSFAIGEGSPDPGGLPTRYIIKFAITVGVGLLGLQGLAVVARSVLTLRE